MMLELSRKQDTKRHRLPNFVGIGAPKAGTTWLNRCLSEHPDVFMAPVKETEFFKNRDANSRIDEYAVYFAGATSEKAVGEFTVRYLAMPEVPDRIANGLPQAKIVVSLRNPLEQVGSWFWHLKKQNRFATGNTGDICLEEAIERFADILLTPAFYHRHLQNWFRHFSREQVHVIVYDDICSQPARVLRELFRFLEVDTAFVPPSTHSRDAGVRRGTSPRSHTAGKLHRAAYRTLNRIYLPLKRSLGTRSAAALKDRLRVRQVLERLFHRAGYPEMSATTRAVLVELFSDDVASLSAQIGRDCTAWLK